MPRYRRTAYCLLYCHDTGFIDIELFLRGTVAAVAFRQVLGLSALTGAPAALSPEELELFQRVPSVEWTEPTEAEVTVWAQLARKGLLVSDDDDEDELRELRRRDEALASGQWHAFAALYHFFTRWQGRNVWHELGEPDLDAATEEIRGWGDPPTPFHSLGTAARTLPAPMRGSAFDDVLRRRQTTRGFDDCRSMTMEQFATVLASTFGCDGYADVGAGLVALHKASPSGGGLHPTEAYPLVRDVEGVEPGLYHYDVARHALEVVETMPAGDVGDLAVRIAAGQPFARDAHVLVLLTSRFERNFWKYRRHDRAYTVLLMDAAHLSQTFYLVCADLGLGAFVTAAVNDVDAEEALGLDGYREGALALLGCGPPAPSPLDPAFLPYVAGETALEEGAERRRLPE